jgi:hypothetical protein
MRKQKPGGRGERRRRAEEERNEQNGGARTSLYEFHSNRSSLLP